MTLILSILRSYLLALVEHGLPLFLRATTPSTLLLQPLNHAHNLPNLLFQTTFVRSNGPPDRVLLDAWRR